MLLAISWLVISASAIWVPFNPSDAATGGRVAFRKVSIMGMASMLEPLYYNTTGYGDHIFATSADGTNCSCGLIKSTMVVSMFEKCISSTSICLGLVTAQTDGHCIHLTVKLAESWTIPPFTLMWPETTPPIVAPRPDTVHQNRARAVR